MNVLVICYIKFIYYITYLIITSKPQGGFGNFTYIYIFYQLVDGGKKRRRFGATKLLHFKKPKLIKELGAQVFFSKWDFKSVMNSDFYSALNSVFRVS